MILVEAYHVIGVALTLNGLVYLLVEGLQEHLARLATCVLENLISRLADTLCLVSRHSLIDDVLSDSIAREGDKLNIRYAFEVGLQLGLYKC